MLWGSFSLPAMRHGGMRRLSPARPPCPYPASSMTGKIWPVMEAVLDFWLTTGRFAAAFEKSFSEFLGTRHTCLCNSGSSANLLAISCLTSPKLKDRRLQPGDEVITLAAGFPTTVNPFDLDAVTTFCRKHDLWLIEDSCDALGATYELGSENDTQPSASHRYGTAQRGEGGDLPANERRERLYTGAIGDIATFSFYPAHHITMGEGGAVVTNSGELKQLIESFRDWGRDCWCETGHNNTCRNRFDQQLGELPLGYDHKYTYSHIGYNLKLTDLQAALGVSQLKKLPKFIEIRRQNFQILYEGLKNLEEFFILPEATPHSQPSWFGFPIAVRPEAPFSRHDLIRYLDQAKIDTRLLFGGNLTRQPAFQDVTYRKVGELKNSDFVMSQVFWVGVYPGCYFTLDVKRKRVYSSKYDSIICL